MPDQFKTIAEIAATLGPNLDEAVGLGVRAQALLRDETLALAVRDAKADIIRKWSGAASPEEREQLHSEFKAIDAVLGKLNTFYQKGQLALEQRNQAG